MMNLFSKLDQIILAMIIIILNSKRDVEVLGQNCLLESNTRFYGNDIGTIFASTAFDCCFSCTLKPSCTSFTFNNLNNSCILKNLNPNYIIRIKNDLAYTSGIINTNVISTTTNSPNTCSLNPVPLGTCPSYLEYDVEYKGYDLVYSFATSPQACCGICLNTASCTGFTYVSFFQICWLKNFTIITSGLRVCSKGRISSIVNPLMTSYMPTTPTTSVATTSWPFTLTTLITLSPITTQSTMSSFTTTTNEFITTSPTVIPPISSTTQESTIPPDPFTTTTTSLPSTSQSQNTTLPTTPTCKLEENIRYILNKFAESSIPDANFCCQICLATPICRAYTYNLLTQMCSLMKIKPTDQQRSNDTNTISGVIIP